MMKVPIPFPLLVVLSPFHGVVAGGTRGSDKEKKQIPNGSGPELRIVGGSGTGDEQLP